MKMTSFGVLVLVLLAPLAATAQPTALPGLRYPTNTNPSAETAARFAIGMTMDSGTSYIANARENDLVTMVGQIKPEASHIGLKADLFVVDLNNLGWTMRNLNGSFVPWSYRVPELVPYMQEVTLTANLQVTLYTGPLSLAGVHQFFIGYKPKDGTLYYTPVPLRVTIAELTATEKAYNQFVASISPNIVQTRCVACHVKGGIAQIAGAYHVFQTPLPDFLDANFKTFQGLVSNRGVSYILSKVTGGNNHGGGVQLTSNSVDYSDLAFFLALVAQGVPDLSTTQVNTNTNNNMNDNPYDNPYGNPYY